MIYSATSTLWSELKKTLEANKKWGLLDTHNFVGTYQKMKEKLHACGPAGDACLEGIRDFDYVESLGVLERTLKVTEEFRNEEGTMTSVTRSWKHMDESRYNTKVDKREKKIEEYNSLNCQLAIGLLDIMSDKLKTRLRTSHEEKFDKFIKEGNGHGLFFLVKEFCELNAGYSVAELRQAWSDRKYKDGELVEDFIADFEDLLKALKLATAVDDAEVVMVFRSSILAYKREFDRVIPLLFNRQPGEHEFPTEFAPLKSALIAYYGKDKVGPVGIDHVPSEKQIKAYIARTGARFKKRMESPRAEKDPRGYNKASGERIPLCYRCGRDRHKGPDCKSVTDVSTLKCDKCDSIGSHCTAAHDRFVKDMEDRGRKRKAKESAGDVSDADVNHSKKKKGSLKNKPFKTYMMRVNYGSASRGGGHDNSRDRDDDRDPDDHWNQKAGEGEISPQSNKRISKRSKRDSEGSGSEYDRRSYSRDSRDRGHRSYERRERSRTPPKRNERSRSPPRYKQRDHYRDDDRRRRESGVSSNYRAPLSVSTRHSDVGDRSENYTGSSYIVPPVPMQTDVSVQPPSVFSSVAATYEDSHVAHRVPVYSASYKDTHPTPPVSAYQTASVRAMKNVIPDEWRTKLPGGRKWVEAPYNKDYADIYYKDPHDKKHKATAEISGYKWQQATGHNPPGSKTHKYLKLKHDYRIDVSVGWVGCDKDFDPNVRAAYEIPNNVPERYRASKSIKAHENFFRILGDRFPKVLVGLIEGILPPPSEWEEKLNLWAAEGITQFLWDFYRTVFPHRLLLATMPDTTILLNNFYLVRCDYKDEKEKDHGHHVCRYIPARVSVPWESPEQSDIRCEDADIPSMKWPPFIDLDNRSGFKEVIVLNPNEVQTFVEGTDLITTPDGNRGDVVIYVDDKERARFTPLEPRRLLRTRAERELMNLPRGPNAIYRCYKVDFQNKLLYRCSKTELENIVDLAIERYGQMCCEEDADVIVPEPIVEALTPPIPVPQDTLTTSVVSTADVAARRAEHNNTIVDLSLEDDEGEGTSVAEVQNTVSVGPVGGKRVPQTTDFYKPPESGASSPLPTVAKKQTKPRAKAKPKPKAIVVPVIQADDREVPVDYEVSSPEAAASRDETESNSSSKSGFRVETQEGGTATAAAVKTAPSVQQPGQRQGPPARPTTLPAPVPLNPSVNIVSKSLIAQNMHQKAPTNVVRGSSGGPGGSSSSGQPSGGKTFMTKVKSKNTQYKDMITIDSASTVNIEMNLRHVRNFIENHDVRTNVEGLGGATWRVDFLGDDPRLGRFMVVPSATTCLLSVPQIVERGFTVIFRTDVDEDDYEDTVAEITGHGVTVIGRRNDCDHFCICREDWKKLQQAGNRHAVSAVSFVGVANMRTSVWDEIDERGRREVPLSVNSAADVRMPARNGARLTSSRKRAKAAGVGPVSLAPAAKLAEQSRIDKVTIIHNLYHCSYDVMVNALLYGVLVGTGITLEDVKIWKDNYQCHACEMGKAIKKSFKHNSPNTPADVVGGCVHCDIVGVYDKNHSLYDYYILGVDEFTSHMSFVPIISKHTQSLLKAFKTILAQYRRYEHDIRCIQTDSESGFKACDTELGLAGIELRCTPPYQHEQRIERYIRTVKDRMRIVIESLPYELPVRFYGEMMRSIVDGYNDLPNSKRKDSSPRLLVSGRLTDVSKKVLHPFGTIAFANIAGKEQHSTECRAEIGVILGPSLLTYGAVRFYTWNSDDETESIVDRSDFKICRDRPLNFPWKARHPSQEAPQFDENVMFRASHGWDRLSSEPLVTLRSVLEVPDQEGDDVAAVEADVSNSDVGASHQPAHLRHQNTKRLPTREGDFTVLPEVAGDSEWVQSKGLSPPEQLATTQEGGFTGRSRERVGSPPVSGTISSKKLASLMRTTTSGRCALAGRDPTVSPEEPAADEVVIEIETSLLRKRGGAYRASSVTVENVSEPIHGSACPASSRTAKAEKSNASSRHVATHNYYEPANRYFLRRAPKKSVREPLNEVPSRQGRRKLLKTWRKSDSRKAFYVVKSFRVAVHTAVQGPHAREAVEAIQDEIQNMIDYKVGHYVRLRQIPYNKRGNIIHSFMFIKYKVKPDGSFDKVKARLVGNGKLQKEYMYDFVSSSTVALSSVLMLLNLASYFRCELASYDVKGAFLNAEFGPDDVTTYLKINREVTKEWIKVDSAAAAFVDEKGELLLELDKFIYGLKQAPYKFQQHLKAFLLDEGYVRCVSDECVYTKHVGKDWSILSTHVDDILQIATTPVLVDDLHKALIKKYKEVTFHANADSYIGINIERSVDRRQIRLTQGGLADKIVEEHGDKSQGVTYTPCSDQLFKSSASRGKPVNQNQYLSCIMSLMYLARLTRPDILLATTYLATKSHCCSEGDLKEAKKVVKYIRSTRDLGILLECNDLQLTVYCDASQLIHADGAGHTGYFIGFGPNCSYIHSRSGKQKTYAQSSTDAEILALTECLKMVVWTRELLHELEVTEKQQVIVYEDNEAVMKLMDRSGDVKRTKHVLSKVNFCRQLVEREVVLMRKVATKSQTADMHTKPLHGKLFKKHASHMMNLDYHESDWETDVSDTDDSTDEGEVSDADEPTLKRRKN